jgi:phage shock protein PspC (stress-responsive transcriptional regulator)
MSEFQAYLTLGFSHITDLSSYDHILFVVALCAIYSFREWKKVLILITAFTIGHSITLGLATLNVLSFQKNIVELLIPITIFITGIGNYFQSPKSEVHSPTLRYVLTVCFGLIHGMGFSTYLRSLLGGVESIIIPLFAFNLGLEIGQLAIVALALLVTTLCIEILKVKRFTWNHLISGIVAGMALSLILNNEFLKTLF